MDLKKTILAEHSKAQTEKIVRYVGNDPKRFAELIKLFFEGEYRITQRAAWPMSYCVRAHPALIKPYFKPLVKNLEKKNLHDAVIRNSLRLLQDIAIPKVYHGRLMTICFDYIQSNEMPQAIKAFSLSILHNFSKQYPEILPELKLIVQERWPHEKAAFRSRGKRILDYTS
ncbi:MAG TPA: hypothetical protein VK543_14840 [Puia sp.]|nr:hypothetical protein [Puia sp.]